MDDSPTTDLRSCSEADGLEIFAELPGSIRRQLQSICRRRLYRPGETVSEAGTRPEFVGIVGDGILTMQKSLPDGRQHVVGLLVAGDMFGRLFDAEMHFSVEAAIETEVFAFRRAPFETILLDRPELDRVLLLNLLSELDRARDWMVILANPKVRGRLAGFLLLMCTRFRTVDHLITVKDRAIRIHIPLSRPDLANLLGTRIESVSRALHALARDGLITILRPDFIELRRLEALAEEAGEPELVDPATLRRMIQAAQGKAG